MKKMITSAITALVVMQASAQKTEANTNLKVNLLSPIVRTVSVAVEQKVSTASTAQVGFYYTGFSGADVKLRGFGITPEYRYYAGRNEAFNGFYLAPFARYQDFKVSDDLGSSGKLSTIGGGLLVGNQWIFNKKITLDAFIGPSYNKGKVKVTAGDDDLEIPSVVNGFGIRTGINLGIAF